MDQGSAVIIPFPSRPGVARLGGPERLSRAVAALDAALEEQKRAVALWRSATDDLKASMKALGGNLRNYQGRLDTLASEIEALQAQARQLDPRTDPASIGTTPHVAPSA